MRRFVCTFGNIRTAPVEESQNEKSQVLINHHDLRRDLLLLGPELEAFALNYFHFKPQSVTALFSVVSLAGYVETADKCRIYAYAYMLLQDTWVVPDPIEWDWPTPQPVDTGAQLLFMLLLFAVVVVCIACILRLRRKNPPPTVPVVVKTPAPLVLVVCPYCGTKNEQGIINCRKCGAEI